MNKTMAAYFSAAADQKAISSGTVIRDVKPLSGRQTWKPFAAWTGTLSV